MKIARNHEPYHTPSKIPNSVETQKNMLYIHDSGNIKKLKRS